MSRLLLTEPIAAAAIDLCKTCGEPAETPFAYCRAHRLTARPYQTIDINALDPLDPVHALEGGRFGRPHRLHDLCPPERRLDAQEFDNEVYPRRFP